MVNQFDVSSNCKKIYSIYQIVGQNRRRKINMVIDQTRQFAIILIELSHTQTEAYRGLHTLC